MGERTAKESGVKPQKRDRIRHPMLQVLRLRNLRLLWIGQAISVLGTQFHLIALPWLVLQLTGDPFLVGTVLAVAGIPRALLMLVGGVYTDRFSPRTVMIGSNFVRMLLVGSLAFLVLADAMTLWMLFAFALAFGVADAFYYPAQSSMMPQIVEPEHLLAGNAIVQGTAQLSIAVGPALAGLLIALFSGNPDTPALHETGSARTVPMTGIGLAFSFNTATFLVSLITLWMIRIPGSPGAGAGTYETAGLLSSIRHVMGFVLADRTLRLLILVTAVGHFCVEGPLIVGVPVLADTRFAGGAAAFGIIMSALGAGMLIGIILAGTLPALPPKRMGIILLTTVSSSGLGLVAVGVVKTVAPVAAIVLAMGTALGFVIIQYTSWIQTHAPRDLLGRIMSLMIFSSIGLVPVSQALSGALIKLNTAGLFIGAGAMMTVIVGLIAFRPEIRAMGLRGLEDQAI